MFIIVRGVTKWQHLRSQSFFDWCDASLVQRIVGSTHSRLLWFCEFEFREHKAADRRVSCSDGAEQLHFATGVTWRSITSAVDFHSRHDSCTSVQRTLFSNWIVIVC
jgi:hypothetical protein